MHCLLSSKDLVIGCEHKNAQTLQLSVLYAWYLEGIGCKKCVGAPKWKGNPMAAHSNGQYMINNLSLSIACVTYLRMHIN